MSKKLFMLLILLISFQSMIGQAKLGQSWLIGNKGYRIKFDGNNIIHDTTYIGLFAQRQFDESKTNICDTNGNIRYVSDGVSVFHSDGSFVENADSLEYQKIMNFGITDVQKSLFLPMQNDKTYFVSANMTDSAYDYNDTSIIGATLNAYDQLNYSILDGQSNNGLGKVTLRMQSIISNKLLGRSVMNACRHGNGKDWWLLKHAADSNDLYCVRLTQDSVLYERKLKFPTSVSHITTAFYYGQLIFNSLGSQLAIAKTDTYFLLADFDRCHGVISNFKQINYPLPTYSTPFATEVDSITFGINFSPNGRFVYISSGFTVMQYDQWDNTFYKVCEIDTTWDQFWGYTSLHLGPDNKIYIGHFGGGSKQYSRIDNPDEKGLACNFCRKCLRAESLGFAWFENPPHLPDYALGAVPGGCWPLATENIAMDKSWWEVYPNPTSSKFIIKSDKLLGAKQFFNAIGQLILTTKENEIDVSHLPKGMYFLKCEGSVKKVMVE